MDKLGKRLAAQEQVSDDDLDMLLEVLSAYQEAESEAQVRLMAAGYRATTRTKTTGVLIDKLRREHSSLKSVQDIAGARIVVDGGREEQDRAVRNIEQAFAHETRPPKVKDRRVDPSSGYRAVHVIVTVLDLPVEIQVRTPLQDQWAQIVESLGDKWGRGIRYGEAPPGPDVAITPGFDMTRSRLWEIVQHLGQRIDTIESGQAILNQLLRAEDERALSGVLTEAEEIERLAGIDETTVLKERLERAEEQLSNELVLFREFAEYVVRPR